MECGKMERRMRSAAQKGWIERNKEMKMIIRKRE